MHTHIYIYVCICMCHIKKRTFLWKLISTSPLTMCVFSRSCGRNYVLEQSNNYLHALEVWETDTLCRTDETLSCCWSVASESILGTWCELDRAFLWQPNPPPFTTCFFPFCSLLLVSLHQPLNQAQYRSRRRWDLPVSQRATRLVLHSFWKSSERANKFKVLNSAYPCGGSGSSENPTAQLVAWNDVKLSHGDNFGDWA